ncbi:hypothetical protein BDB00DRAFT_832382 [Zychaea mexicana]|uniref:uncharacterized protein n=1 Tax=Zychaea mexicana TaxID=64656 RepID=UPI0022FF240B|nr:uncharacterized protein BDB00DRAFT_832382 [Zychaea mexicana]KAI9491486.1 hypothetical protein BDB00DRAFT_832382 [Zychaea mexicana]
MAAAATMTAYQQPNMMGMMPGQQPGMMDPGTMAMMQQQQQQQQQMMAAMNPAMNSMYPQTPGAGMMAGVGGFMNPQAFGAANPMMMQMQQQPPYMGAAGAAGGMMMPGQPYDYFGAAGAQYDPYAAYAQQMPGYGAGMYTSGMGPMSMYDPTYGRRYLPERNYISSVKDLWQSNYMY